MTISTENTMGEGIMRITKILAAIVTFFFITMLSINTGAQTGAADTTGSSTGSQGSSFFNELLNNVGEVLNEKLKDEFDKWLGKYDGKIKEVRLLEQTPDSVVLEVTYSGIKQQDGVSAKGEVLRGGMVLSGFTSTLGQVQGKEGIARLTITREAASGWDTSAPATETSDQLRLYLVRSDYPDRHFGELVYDFPKTWGEDAYGIEAGVDEGEAIELGEGESAQEGGQQPPVVMPGVIKPGAILVPVNKGQGGSGTPGVHGSNTGIQKIKPAIKLAPPVSHYDFYQNASKAKWRSSRGALSFPGKTDDSRGFVIAVPRGKVGQRGTAAIKILETHPAWSDNGWIEGRYPALTPASKVHFLSNAGFLQGANASNGAIFKVYVHSFKDNKTMRVYQRHVSPRRLAPIDIDLSRWAGQRIEIILRVEAGGNSAQDWAVWIAPRLARK